MNVEIMVTVAVFIALAAGFILGRWSEGCEIKIIGKDAMGAPKVEPLEERELIRVGLMNEEDPAVRAPLHIAEAMRTAKCLAVGESINGIVPSTEKVAESVWMAAGYVAACREFERLWLKVREDAKRAEKK
jgi:hypothetical protein